MTEFNIWKQLSLRTGSNVNNTGRKRGLLQFLRDSVNRATIVCQGLVLVSRVYKWHQYP